MDINPHVQDDNQFGNPSKRRMATHYTATMMFNVASENNIMVDTVANYLMIGQSHTKKFKAGMQWI